MATKRLSMRQTREILRQKFLLGRSHREIAHSLGVSVGVVGMAASRARVAGLDWAQVETLPDDALDARLYRRAAMPTGDRPVPDGAYLHMELRKPGVTLQLLHEEYLQQHPATGYRYTQFCSCYNRWLDRLLASGELGADRAFFLRRLSFDNRWAECSYDAVATARYGGPIDRVVSRPPFPRANALGVLQFRRG